MNVECKKSCGLCDKKPEASRLLAATLFSLTTSSQFDLAVFLELCKDEFNHCPVFAKRGDCKNNPHYMLDKCKRSCNLCGDLVEQKDRIQVTTKKMKIRRPNLLTNASESNDSKKYILFFILFFRIISGIPKSKYLYPGTIYTIDICVKFFN